MLSYLKEYNELYSTNMSGDSVSVKIGSSTIANSTEEKLLGVTLDSKLTFEQHVSNLCQKVSNKLYALSRIAHYMDQAKLSHSAISLH